MPSVVRPAALLLLALTACADGSDGGSVACGLAAMNGPLVALQGFARGDALAAAPTDLPLELPGRYVAGPSGTIRLATTDSGLVRAAMTTPPPAAASPGFGVLVVERSGAPMGVLIHDGATIPGAIVLGTVEVADGAIPLYGVRVTRAAVETEACPLFAPLVAQ